MRIAFQDTPGFSRETAPDGIWRQPKTPEKGGLPPNFCIQLLENELRWIYSPWNPTLKDQFRVEKLPAAKTAPLTILPQRVTKPLLKVSPKPKGN